MEQHILQQKNLEILNLFMKLNRNTIPKKMVTSVGSGKVGMGNSDISLFYKHIGRLPKGKEIKYFLTLHSNEIFEE